MPATDRVPLGWSVAVGLLIITLIVGAANLWATYDQVHASQQKWCRTLDTLASADQGALAAPASRHPDGTYSLALIRDFRDLRSRLGCA